MRVLMGIPYHYRSIQQAHLFQLSGEEYIYEALVKKADSFSGRQLISLRLHLHRESSTCR